MFAGVLATNLVEVRGVPSRREFRTVFVEAYSRFAPVLRAIGEPALAIVAIDRHSGHVAGLRVLPARIGMPAAAIVGRHEYCDIALPGGGGTLALRQLAVVVDPATHDRPARHQRPAIGYRVLDLQSQHVLCDEDGRSLRGLATSGPAMIGCLGYVIFLVPIGDPADWPACADDAWAMLPERIYGGDIPIARGSLAGCPTPAGIYRAAAPSTAACSMVLRTAEPRSAAHELVDGDAIGTLELVGPLARVTVGIGAAALRDGVLVGRYDRCDLAVTIGDPTLSRIHALLVAIAGRLVVVDTASRHGLAPVGGARTNVLVFDLPASIDFQLGTYTRVRWCSVMS